MENMNENVNFIMNSDTNAYTDPVNQPVNEPINREVPKPVKKKKKGGFKKVMALILSGVLLGSVAGVTFYGTTAIANHIDPLAKVLAAVGVVDEDVADKIFENASKEKEEIETVPTLQTGVQQITTVTDISEIAKDVMPSLVSIVNEYTATQNFGYFGSYEQTYKASGSGIIVGQNDTELLLVTNYHVVEDADRLVITFVDDSTADATIKGSAKTMDLAVIAVSLDSLTEETKREISIAKLGDSDSLLVGEPAIAIGNALGYGQSVTTGVISALDREIQMESDYGITGTFIQTDAAINPGNSGGALLNMRGEVIGINSSKIGGSTIEGMGYAIPISAARPIIEELLIKADRQVVPEGSRGYMGVIVTNATDYMQSDVIPAGAYIDKVSKDSAADVAGLMAGDIITKFGDDEIASLADLQEALCYYKKGQTIKVTVHRRDKYGEYSQISVELTLQEKPAQ